MHNILRVFFSDTRRIWTNVVAVVVIIGLSVIPCLYAWFNILSNWDPYGPESTGNLQVAVASEDKGKELSGVEINVGDKIIDNLKSNDSINWQFVDTADDAKDGVEAGDYYACLIVDENFTADLLSFLGGNPDHPTISYYENEKKNAIAPKITGKVKTTVQNSVDSAFVSTLAKGLLEAGNYMANADFDGDGNTGLTTATLNQLHRMDGDLSTALAIIDSYISLIDTTQSLMDASSKVSSQMSDMLAATNAMASSAQAATTAAGNTMETASDMITMSLNNSSSNLEALRTGLTDAVTKAGGASQLSSDQVDLLTTAAESIQTQAKADGDQAKADAEKLADEEKQKLITEDTTALDASIDTLKQDLTKLKDAQTMTSEDLDALVKKINGDIDDGKSKIKTLNDSYVNSVKPNFRSTLTDVQNSLLSVEKLVGQGSSSIQGVAAILNSYPDMMGLGKQSLQSTRDQIVDLQTKLEGIIADMEGLDTNSQYQMLMKLLETDPELVADFIASPIDLDTQILYPMENNGSATAPFYIILSIWVGALILAAILGAKLEHPEEFNKLKTYQEFFGRYILFFLIGQIQTAITVLGALFYVGIQCIHPIYFFLACQLTSMIFTLFMFSLKYAFGAVGEAAAVVLMVIQVAGSGGTFPVQVLPELYQVLYKFMPFQYAMNAVRECIAGMYKNDYAIYLSKLCIYIPVALVIGLLISIPCKKLIHLIEESNEKTDLMA